MCGACWLCVCGVVFCFFCVFNIGVFFVCEVLIFLCFSPWCVFVVCVYMCNFCVVNFCVMWCFSLL